MIFWACACGLLITDIAYYVGDHGYYDFANSAQAQMFFLSVMLLVDRKSIAKRMASYFICAWCAVVMVTDRLECFGIQYGILETIFFAVCIILCFLFLPLRDDKP